ncbi:flagellar biosynthetic protein FliR [Treponema bryantii]|uniref:Flagellar biosynthetic protein FliR n=1 Tax=Treponema bryantii TaxID=163 RepID=A0A1H9J0Y1_9SPIR|nr:flagellar biosynthetic protein FliR [Treponema bryantii]SEQ80510.1 flagellar biosynthetic protein FliR [Treponema bryantii]
MLDSILLKAPVYLIVFVRCFALILTLPMFSMRSASRVAKVAIAGYMAFFIYGGIDASLYQPYIGDDGAFSMIYVLLLIGEALIGIIMGFFISIIFAAFSSAGQFLAFQMGLSAASSYDALSQVENPLMGQFFNLVAMLVFMQTHWFQKLFLGGLVSSFSSLSALSIATANEKLARFMISGLTGLFSDALVIALPVMGTLFLITVCTGLLTKAAPQMNLLSEGFPIMILVAFTIIAIAMPSIIDFFVRSFNKGFADLENLFTTISGGV